VSVEINFAWLCSLVLHLLSAEIWLLRHMPSNLQGTQLITRPKLEAAPNPTWVGLAIFLALLNSF